MTNETIQELIQSERNRQDRLFPGWREQPKPPEKWLALAIEELGEIANDINNNQSPIVEMIQLTSLMLAWLEVFEWEN